MRDPTLGKADNRLGAAVGGGQRHADSVELVGDQIEAVGVSAREAVDGLGAVTHRHYPPKRRQDGLHEGATGGVGVLRLIDEHPLVAPEAHLMNERQVDHVVKVNHVSGEVRRLQCRNGNLDEVFNHIIAIIAKQAKVVDNVVPQLAVVDGASHANGALLGQGDEVGNAGAMSAADVVRRCALEHLIQDSKRLATLNLDLGEGLAVGAEAEAVDGAGFCRLPVDATLQQLPLDLLRNHLVVGQDSHATTSAVDCFQQGGGFAGACNGLQHARTRPVRHPIQEVCLLRRGGEGHVLSPYDLSG